MRSLIEKRAILTAEPLANSGARQFSIRPLNGMGLRKIRLHIAGTTSAGAADPITWGLYQWIKGISLQTSAGEKIYNGVPGMALYKMNQYFDRCAPYHTPVLAAAGTYYAVLDLPLVFPFLARPEDTILDTGRYDDLSLDIATGAPGDVLVTPAANTLVCTLGIELIGTKATLPSSKVADVTKAQKGQPGYHFYCRTYPMLHADVATHWDIESADDEGMLGFMLYNHGASGIPFIGSVAAPANDHVTNVFFEDASSIRLRNVQATSFQQERRELCSNDAHAADLVSPTLRLGEYPHMFVKDGFLGEMYSPGGKALAELHWTNATATDETDLITWGVRTLRPV
ncbi:MAG: hypothetical protein IMZ71_02225 [Chloroflexi bacterium]|nr:hypothetical protein [Chloroflexota bacterium]